jgi:hypothetical protein
MFIFKNIIYFYHKRLVSQLKKNLFIFHLHHITNIKSKIIISISFFDYKKKNINNNQIRIINKQKEENDL